MDESDFPFSHTSSHEPTDPVNVVVRGISFQELSDYLAKLGWRTPSLSYARFLPVPGTIDELPTSHELVFEKTPRGIWDRIHVRLWSLEPDSSPSNSELLLGNVHRDVTKLLGHVAANFEAAKSFLTQTCSTNPAWQVKNHEVELGNKLCAFEEPYHCGRALLIERMAGGGR